MNVANVATLDIQVATLIPLEQAFNHVSQFNILLYFLYFFLNVFSLAINPHLLAWTTFRWYGICGFSDLEGFTSRGGGASGGADRRGGNVLKLTNFIKWIRKWQTLILIHLENMNYVFYLTHLIFTKDKY